MNAELEVSRFTPPSPDVDSALIFGRRHGRCARPTVPKTMPYYSQHHVDFHHGLLARNCNGHKQVRDVSAGTARRAAPKVAVTGDGVSLTEAGCLFARSWQTGAAWFVQTSVRVAPCFALRIGPLRFTPIVEERRRGYAFKRRHRARSIAVWSGRVAIQGSVPNRIRECLHEAGSQRRLRGSLPRARGKRAPLSAIERAS
jgi:hypothetical protein